MLTHQRHVARLKVRATTRSESIFSAENTLRRTYKVSTDQSKRCPGRTQRRYELPLTCFLCSHSAKRERGQIHFSPIRIEYGVAERSEDRVLL